MLLTARKRKGFRLLLTRFRRCMPIYALMLPGIAATFIFSYIPMYGVQIAFKDFKFSKGIWGSPWVGLQHFIRFTTYIGFWTILRNTLSITLYTLATFPITIIIALLLNELRSQHFKKVVQMVSYAPHFLSTVVLCGMIMLFFGRSNGVVNNILELLGFERIDFLTSESMFADIYVWSGVWQGVGWGTIIYLAALSGVSPELVEAAQIDGASRLQIIRHVHIPGILPTVIIMFILATGNLLSLGYEKILLLQNDLNLSVSRVISSYVYEIGLQGGQLSYSTAINFFNNVVNILILLGVNWIATRTSEVSLW